MKTKLYSLISVGFLLATFLSSMTLNAQELTSKSSNDQTRTIRVVPCECEIVSQQNVSCHNGSDGEATVVVTGDGGPFTFLWSDGQTTATATGLSAGTYTVEVFTAAGINCGGSCTVTIEEPALLECSIVGTDLLCNGDANGTADLTVTGGTAPFTYLWSNGETTEDLSGLDGGDYSVEVTDANGCTTSCDVSIDEPALLECSIVGTDLLCNGDANGTADLTVTGGTAPFTYLWSNGETTEDLSGLDGGDYSVEVTDANGCTTSCDVSIDEPALLECSIVGTDLLCNGDANGTADLTVTGGTAPFTYLWSNGETTEDLSGLDGGDYSVEVTDANGCTTSCDVSIDEPALLECSIVGTDLLCNGDANGTADLTVTGGTAPFTYLWSNGETTEDLSGLDGGDYSVEVTDANGCTTSCDVSIDEPALLECSIVGTDLLCYGDANGTADLTVTGGTVPFTYIWSNGETTEDLSGLDGGDYSVDVTDANGCTTSCDVTINESPLLECEITEIINGGGGPGEDDCGECEGQITSLDLEYQGSETDANIKVYKGKVQPDKLIAEFDNVNNGDIFSFVGTGNSNKMGSKIRITVNDGSGYTEIHTSCSQEIYVGMVVGDFEITAGTSHEGGPLCGGDPGEEDCEDGSATANAIGGTPPYSYLWSDGQTTATATNLLPGIYTVTITDANGCTSTCTAEIECEEEEEECGECEGQMTSLDLEYLGNETDATITIYKDKVQDDKIIEVFENVNTGDILSFVGTGNANKMGAKIRIVVNDESGYTEIHTSCSQDIYVGMIAGDFEITAGTSHEGGPLCPGTPPDEEDCGECEGQITSLDLQYQGDETDATIKVYKGKVQPDKLFATFMNVNLGDILSFVGPGNSNKMGSKIRITISNEAGYTEIHTSCSQDIYVGMVVGDFEITAGTSHEGGPLCEEGDKLNESAITDANLSKGEVEMTAYPNPSHQGDVTISFKVPVTTRARLEVYNVMGERVAILFDEIVLENSVNLTTLDASELSPGIYFYRLNVNSDEIKPVTISKLIITK